MVHSQTKTKLHDHASVRRAFVNIFRIPPRALGILKRPPKQSTDTWKAHDQYLPHERKSERMCLGSGDTCIEREHWPRVDVISGVEGNSRIWEATVWREGSGVVYVEPGCARGDGEMGVG